MTPLLPLFLLAGCTSKVAVLETRVEGLEAENAELRARLDAVEAQAAETQGKVEQWDRLMEMATSVLDRPASGTTARPTTTADDGPRCEAVEEGRFRYAGPLEGGEMFERMRVIPHYTDGTVDGMRLLAIRRTSLPASCGFRNGDVLHAVNGHAFLGVDANADGWKAAASADRLQVDVTRRGRAVRWVIERGE